MSSDVEIVPYRPELKDALIELWSEAFTSPSDRRSYFEWKYERNPYIQEPFLVLAMDGSGRVVGTRGFHGSRWCTPEEDVLIPCAEDFAIAREHRDSGLATAIMRVASESLAERGYRYVMSASGGQVTVLHSLATGWKSIGAMEPVAYLATRERARQRARRLALRSGPFVRVARFVRSNVYRPRETSFDRLDHVRSRPASHGDAAIVVTAALESRALATAAEHRLVDGRIRHVRDPAFFCWRFQHPRREYRFLLYEVGGRVDGYLALSRNRSPHAATAPCHIADWEGRSHRVRAELLDFALKHGGFDTLGAWTGSLPPESRALLARSGFHAVQPDLRARGMPCVLLKTLGAPGDLSIGCLPALEPSSWDIRYIDSMRG